MRRAKQNEKLLLEAAPSTLPSKKNGIFICGAGVRITYVMTTAYNYADLQGYWRKGLRNGNWRKLNPLKKGLYMAARWYARGKGEILSVRLMAMLGDIIEKLVETVKDRIIQVGLAKAADMEKAYEKMFSWAPELRKWLKDPDYIFWLGVMSFRRSRVRRRKISVKK